MKNIISIACLLLSMCFVACNDDDSEEKGPQLAFSRIDLYIWMPREPLEVEIRVSEPVPANTLRLSLTCGVLPCKGKSMSFRLMSSLFPREREPLVLP